MENTLPSAESEALIRVHACDSCGRASRRDEQDGTPNPFDVFHCSLCGHEEPLRVQIMSESDVDVHL
jgi:hypothetical protein